MITKRKLPQRRIKTESEDNSSSISTNTNSTLELTSSEITQIKNISKETLINTVKSKEETNSNILYIHDDEENPQYEYKLKYLLNEKPHFAFISNEYLNNIFKEYYDEIQVEASDCDGQFNIDLYWNEKKWKEFKDYIKKRFSFSSDLGATNFKKSQSIPNIKEIFFNFHNFHVKREIKEKIIPEIEKIRKRIEHQKNPNPVYKKTDELDTSAVIFGLPCLDGDLLYSENKLKELYHFVGNSLYNSGIKNFENEWNEARWKKILNDTKIFCEEQSPELRKTTEETHSLLINRITYFSTKIIEKHQNN